MLIRKMLLASAALLSLLVLFSCSSSKSVASKKFVPFTRQLQQRLERDNIDLHQLQFYIDQGLVMSRYVDNEKAQVSAGVIKFDNGQYINEVIVKPFTPGICSDIANSKLMISFEKGNNDVAFGPGSGMSADDYVIYGTDWRNGTALITFDNNKFRVHCSTCSDVAITRLMVRKSEIDKIEKKSRVVEGRTINN
ncbi:MAG TPA: hypothetical protein VHZ50_13845 [Puia sp.]|nr:hypothetical protein [Puia sp.]